MYEADSQQHTEGDSVFICSQMSSVNRQTTYIHTGGSDARFNSGVVRGE